MVIDLFSQNVQFIYYPNINNCTVSQYNNRRLLLLLITHSQIKKISTIKKLFGLFMLDFIVVVIAENGHFQNKSIDRNLNIYWLILCLRCSHKVLKVFEVIFNLPSDFHANTVVITDNVFNVINLQFL